MHFCEQDGFHSLKPTLFLLLSFLDAKHMGKNLRENSIKTPTITQIKPFSLNMHSHSRRANLVTYPNLYFHSATSQYTSKDAKPVPPWFFPVFKDHIRYSLSSPSLASTCTPNFPSWYPPNQPSAPPGK